MNRLDRIRGCLIAGAAGAALGYAVEFLTEKNIFHRYGPKGIVRYTLEKGMARFSDDTQMTLFTLNGLLLARARGEEYLPWIRACYQDWLYTQGMKPAWPAPQAAWIRTRPELCQCRAPGNTCIQALYSKGNGSVARPCNQSKGCGGVMRVAPIGLIRPEILPPDEAALLAAEAAALTHGHALGYLPAAMLAHIISSLTHREASLWDAAADAQQALKRLFPREAHLPALLELIDQAVRLAAQEGVDDLQAIHALGEGWVGEEALAISLYCALRHHNSLEQALIAAVNHRGDSDSTGAITGNILGAALGMQGIPDPFLQNLEALDLLLEMADHLEQSNCGEQSAWRARYL